MHLRFSLFHLQAPLQALRFLTWHGVRDVGIVGASEDATGTGVAHFSLSQLHEAVLHASSHSLFVSMLGVQPGAQSRT